MSTKPNLSCSDGAGLNDPTRLSRVKSVALLAHIQTLEGYIETEIVGLDDHKGQLTVSWASQPTDDDQNQMKLIWELMNEYDVVHEITVTESAIDE